MFEDQIRDGRVAALALPGATPLQGGIPLELDGHVVGAIGVSGNTPQEDEDIAKAGAAAFAGSLATTRPPVSYWKSGEVAAAFAKGSVLFDGEDGRNYMVHASHREGPGMAEVHERDADIIYVLDGSATFVTGGTVEAGKTTAPNEIRGASISDGVTRRISKGDVLIVPAGTPGKVGWTLRAPMVQGAGLASQCVHAGVQPDPAYGAVMPPIYQTSTFAFRDARHGAALFAGEADGFIYTRLGNPTIRALEEAVASLENGCGGIATGSGMGAVSVVYMALLGQGAHLVSTASVYGPSRGLVEKHLSRFGVTATFVDTSDAENVRRALRPETRLIYVETPSNPAMQITDLRAVAAIAHAHGCALAVDNTFASPYLQRPLDLGADVVLHSVTKFINGHADVVGGIIVAKDEALAKELRAMMVILGCNMDPHQAFLVSRGVKTLSLRVERAEQNAARIASWLEAHPKVAWVRYVGLPSHPQHELVQRQMAGFGSMISFELKGGFEAGRRLMDSVELATLAVSLGGVETLIEHPASMTHAGMSEADRLEATPWARYSLAGQAQMEEVTVNTHARIGDRQGLAFLENDSDAGDEFEAEETRSAAAA